jgi:ribosomal-protein-alanine N-acetyltransferase
MSTLHPSRTAQPPLRLYGRRVMLRPLVAPDFEAWSAVRRANQDWLVPWEPQRSAFQPDPTRDASAFEIRCKARDRDRHAGTAYPFGIFVDQAFAGEVNLNHVIRGAMQSGTVGYWIDRARAGNGYVAEAIVVLARFAFDELHLHRLEICIVPRNANSRRVMEKLNFREEGIAQGFLEINGVWEDHVRYGFTIEEWLERRYELTASWL